MVNRIGLGAFLPMCQQTDIDLQILITLQHNPLGSAIQIILLYCFLFGAPAGITVGGTLLEVGGVPDSVPNALAQLQAVPHEFCHRSGTDGCAGSNHL